MFMVLSSRLLYPIMYVQYQEIKYAKNLNIQCFDSKCYRYKTSKVRSIRCKYRTQFGLLPLAYIMQQYKWNTIKIRLLRLIINALYESNFTVIFLLFHQCRNKTSRFREVWQLGTRFSGCCRCGEVAVRGSSTVFSKNRHPLMLLFPSFTRKISPRSENDKIPISYSGITTFSLKPAVE